MCWGARAGALGSRVPAPRGRGQRSHENTAGARSWARRTKEALMGSMLKFDSERRELVRERRNARIERKLERRQARERKHSQTAEVPSAPSATQVRAERELRSALDRIVIDALDRHERIATPASPPIATVPVRDTAAPEPATTTSVAPAGRSERAARQSRRERD